MQRTQRRQKIPAIIQFLAREQSTYKFCRPVRNQEAVVGSVGCIQYTAGKFRMYHQT